MPRELLVDPAWWGADVSWSEYDIALDLAERTATEDVYFEEPEEDPPSAAALDELLASLDVDLASAVRLRVLESLSFREIAVELGWSTPQRPRRGQRTRPDKKRAWRAVRDGLAAMRHAIETEDELKFLDPGGAL